MKLKIKEGSNPLEPECEFWLKKDSDGNIRVYCQIYDVVQCLAKFKEKKTMFLIGNQFFDGV